MLGQFYAFDRPYLERLRRGDVPTAEHFVDYFGRFIRLKLRHRSESKSAIDDIRQETFLRVWVALRKQDGIRQPKRFGAFVTSVCNNVRREPQRRTCREDQAEDDSALCLGSITIGAAEIAAGHELRRQIGRVLTQLPSNAGELIRKIFLDECNRDEVCRDLGVSRQYLRVLLHRAVRQFRKRYLEELSPKTRRHPAKYFPEASSQMPRYQVFETSHWGVSTGYSPRALAVQSESRRLCLKGESSLRNQSVRRRSILATMLPLRCYRGWERVLFESHEVEE
jgi:RNA polymerase sigma-70 factor, ECF subfamily